VERTDLQQTCHVMEVTCMGVHGRMFRRPIKRPYQASTILPEQKFTKCPGVQPKGPPIMVT
jgi:hypothetical protein